MKKLTSFIIILLLLSGCSYKYEAKKDNEALNIVLTSDLHYIDPSLVDDDIFIPRQERSDGKLMIYNEELIDGFISEMLNLKPDMVIISGDLSFNGEKASHVGLAKKLNKLNKEGIKTLVIPGNHDILNTLAIDYSKEPLMYTKALTPDEFMEIYKDFGYSETIKDPASLSYLFKAREDLYLMMLDSNTYEMNSGFSPSNLGLIKDETLKWMDEELSKIPSDTNVILFTHHPILDLANIESYHISNYQDVLNLIDKYQIRLSISGHIHAQNYMNHPLTNHDFYNYGISSLMVYDHQYTILECIDDSYNLYTKNLDMEKYALDNHIDDPFFKDFNNNAYEFFKKYSTTRMVNYFKADDIDKTLSDKLYELMGIMNCYEFKGEMPKFVDILESDSDYEKILEYRKTHANVFFKNIKHFDHDANNLFIK